MIIDRKLSPVVWRSSFLALAAILAAASPAWPISGETPGSEGLFRADCSALPNTPPGSDVVIPCDDDRQRCELKPEGPGGPSEGLAIGFCREGDFAEPRPVVTAGDAPPPPLELGVDLRGTSFGVVTGLRSSTGATSDVYCQTFVTDAGKGVRSCRRIVACGPGGCPSLPACDGLIPTRADDCTALRDQLAGTVTGDPSPNISHWVAMDIDAAPRPGFAVLSVCPRFTAQCADGPQAGGAALRQQPSSTFEYQLPNAAINTPKCLKLDGRTIC